MQTLEITHRVLDYVNPQEWNYVCYYRMGFGVGAMEMANLSSREMMVLLYPSSGPPEFVDEIGAPSGIQHSDLGVVALLWVHVIIVYGGRGLKTE